MPTGWTGGVSSEEDQADSSTYTFLCTELQSRALEKVEAEFKKSQLGPFLGHSVALYAQDEVEGTFADLYAASQACTEWTTTKEDGTQQVWQLTPLSFPQFGDESFAVRVTSEVSLLGILEVDSVYIRKGRFIMSVQYMVVGLQGINSEQTEAFVRIAYEKLQDAF